MKTETKEPTAGHTPLPWDVRVDKRAAEHTKIMHGSAGLASVNPYLRECAANAALICRAVNHHAELVKACKDLLQLHYDTGNATAKGLELVHKTESLLTRLNAK